MRSRSLSNIFHSARNVPKSNKYNYSAGTFLDIDDTDGGDFPSPRSGTNAADRSPLASQRKEATSVFSGPSYTYEANRAPCRLVCPTDVTPRPASVGFVSLPMQSNPSTWNGVVVKVFDFTQE